MGVMNGQQRCSTVPVCETGCLWDDNLGRPTAKHKQKFPLTFHLTDRSDNFPHVGVASEDHERGVDTRGGRVELVEKVRASAHVCLLI